MPDNLPKEESDTAEKVAKGEKIDTGTGTKKTPDKPSA